MAEPATRAELLANMQHDYNAFERLLALLEMKQWTTPGINGEWSMKDLLAHIVAWQQRGVKRLEAARLKCEPDTPLIHTAEESDRFTREHFLANRERSLTEIQADFCLSYKQLRTGVEALSEVDLFERGRFAWMEGDALWQAIALYTSGHYEEHTPDIEKWLTQRRTSRERTQ